MPPHSRAILWLICLCFTFPSAFAGTFIVTTNADSGPGSFRDALTQAYANGTTSRDSIIFSIADNSFAGRTITLLSALPELSSNLAINGASQSGARVGVSDAGILLLLTATTADFNFFELHDCSDVAIYGMAMISTVNTTNNINGICYVRCHNLRIGRASMGNYILGCSNGIYCSSPAHTYQDADSSRNLIIQSNIVGLDINGGLSGTYNGSDLAIEMHPFFLSESFDILLGGDSPADGNTFFGGATAAIWNAVFHNDGYIRVKNNNFGTKKDGSMDPGNYTPTLFNVVASGGDYLISCIDNHFHGAILLDEINNYFTIQGNTIWGTVNQGDVFSGVEISNCYAGGLIGGDIPGQGNIIYNDFSDYFGAYFTSAYDQTSIRIIGTPGVSIKRNMTTCNNYYASTIELLQPEPGAPFVQIDSTGFNFVRGKATPNTRIDIYLDDDCYACEGKQWIGLTMSRADSTWTYSGDFNAAVVATATAGDGSTSIFSQPAIDTGNLQFQQPSCGKNNGYIKGMQTSGNDNVKWHLFHQVSGNWVDSVVSTENDLVNAGPGTYYFDAWIGKGCRSGPVSYKLKDLSVRLDTSAILKNNPDCGKFNGSIKGIVLNTMQDIKIYWKNEQGMLVSDKPDLEGVGPGKYKLVVTDTAGGCMDSSFLYTLINQSGPTVDINTASIMAAKCHGSDGSIKQISLSNISGTALYFWYDEENKLVGTSPDLINVPGGKYVLKVKDESTCDTIITSSITIPSAGGISFDSSAVTIKSTRCTQAYGSIQGIQVSGAGSYSWINTQSGIVVGNGINLLNVPEGNYRLIALSDSGCKDSTGTFHVPDQVAPVMDSSGIRIVADDCGLSDGSISGFTVQGNAPIIYDWFSQDGMVVTQSKNANQLPAGQYYLTVQDVNNCVTTSDLYTIPSKTVTPEPPDYGNITIIRNTAAELQPVNQQPGTYYLYYAVSGVTADQQNTTGRFATGTLLSDTVLYVKLVQGTCESIRSPVKIRVVQTTRIDMPNVFSPNHDGHNELFRLPHPWLVREMQLMVFNRWGRKLFETSDPYQGWDGTVGGTDQPAGTYVWTMRCTDLLGNKQQLSGSLVLIR